MHASLKLLLAVTDLKIYLFFYCPLTVFSTFYQLVQPAYQFMLGHIRTGTLEKFKAAFNNALDEGKGFAAAARDCTKHSMSQFDEESEGMVIDI